MSIFHATLGMQKNLVLDLLNNEFSIPSSLLQIHTYLVRFVHFRSISHILGVFGLKYDFFLAVLCMQGFFFSFWLNQDS